MITKETANRIAWCYREVEEGKKVLADIEEQCQKNNPEHFTDRFGHPRGIEMSVPSSGSSATVYRVPPRLALAVIKSYISSKESELVEASEAARIELENS